MTEDLEAKLEEYRVWALTLGHYSSSTVTRSARRIRELSRVIDVLHPKQKQVLDFFAKERTRGVKPHTMNNQRKDLDSFFRFLGVKMELPVYPEPPPPDPRIPTDEEALALLKAASSSKDRATAARNKLIMELLMFGGIRRGELLSINLDDLRENGIRIRSEKGEAERIIGLPPEMMGEIREYVEHYRSRSDQSALFTTSTGRLSYDYLGHIVKQIGAAAGVKWFHCHAARHWCGTSLLRGMLGSKPLDIRYVQIHLGHKSLKTTQRYTHVSQLEVADQVQKRLGKFFRGDEKMNEVSEWNESGPVHSGAARILHNLTESFQEAFA